MIRELMSSRRFAPLFWAQFFSALNDNVLKNALVIILLYSAATGHGDALVTVAGAVFIFPYFILSGLGGQLADKYVKSVVARRLKFAEIFAAAFAAAGFFLHSVPLLFAALALFGIIAALFGPVKYSMLPDQLELGELATGNALVEGATFMAILLGTVAGGQFVAGSAHMGWVASAVVVLALLSWAFASRIPQTTPSAPDLPVDANPWTSTVGLLKTLHADHRLWDGTVIVSWFWLVGAIVLSLLPALVKDVVGGTEGVVTLCLAIFAIGIAIGSLFAASLSHVRPNLALVPIGAIIMGFAGLDLAWAIGVTAKGQDITAAGFATSFAGLRMLVDFVAFAFGGGLFVVPSFAAVQAWSAPSERARIIAAGNVLQAAFMVVGSLFVALLQAAGLHIGWIFFGLGVASFGAVWFVLTKWGKEGVRDFGGLLFRALFRTEVRGLENLPPAGTRMLIAPNHVSLIDGPLLHAVLPIDASFAVDTGIAKAWWAKPFLRVVKHYTMDPSKPLAARDLIKLVAAGEPVVIFPEGRITVSGSLMKVYDGTAMIADKADAVVVPVRIEGAQRSHLSYLNSSQIKRSWFPRVTVTILPPVKLPVDPALKGKARRNAAGAALQDVMIDALVKNAMLDHSLFEALGHAYRDRDTGKVIIEDALGTKLTYRKLILGAQVLSRKLETGTAVGENVGVLLPNSAGVAVVFMALQNIGRVPAMLNFSAGPVNVLAAMKAAEVKTVLTSKAFIEKGKLDKLMAAISAEARVVYLEDVRASIGVADKIKGLLAGTAPRVARQASDPAVVLFTSGSEGTPKGVVLSHRNILANAAQALARVDANANDKVFNVLPVFHSFGLTGGMMMPMLAGIPIYMYPSPLHYRIVPELIYQTGATILFGTDTFLTGYARSAHAYDFRTLRLVIAGAEAVKDRTRQVFMERYGIRILEGYGVTETAPVLAMNTPMANRPGTVGRLSPLMESRLDPVPGIEEGGRLSVRGPNVMLGYLRAENPGVLEVLPEGWHDTGDIVAIDAAGFITIKGRAKRFAKIAGEMVSLSAVESIAATLWPQAASVAVSIPDPRKGERIVLLTTEKNAERSAMQGQAKTIGASELTVPAAIMVVDKVPLLGTGKTDYVTATTMAREQASAPEREVA
ncbi:acyl-[acyl-carrier-protein]-phospholipid O-acyltransferase/long-chain-fatty-acid--[acyl-carrier-protein] ligase [Bradyrhizobium ottawaense]|uniref:Acyl-[ACP]--phospholipid O-acyltransferase n=3 Tax=Bradyrhizobium TaxID=374 RepID=A0A2U8P0A5_9BRAD|nr:acyl-[ACP]--phospholipid O-acyltransferase [Bradyrhizobium ottawaense]AWL91109.1 acyl-[ACP]--phospholipid O-acyltransferase [Bradyrhizobium ottawaense]MBR1329122.1 acyl-[ACP]--phospholipid O-acyltransferase [Bradyrhizobium ottawaense]MBR1335145.1 acyl-[ACP]--phospholipid O-acyltransferase [Bradyrhizobium ottawaense]